MYILNIYNHDAELVAIIDKDSLAAFTYDIPLNDIGAMSFTIPMSHGAVAVIEQDFVVTIRRYNDRTDTWITLDVAYFIRSWEYYEDESQVGYAIFGGASLEYLLAGRVVDPDDDPLEANGYSTKSGYAETVMHEYIDEQIGASASSERQVPNWSMGLDHGAGSVLGRRLRLESLLESLQSIAQQGGVDFRITWDDGPQFETGVFGTNLTSALFFSEKRGNMINPRISQSHQEEGTTCYALGPGVEDNRSIYRIVAYGATATPYARREFIYDPTAYEDAYDIYLQGLNELETQRAKIAMSFDIDINYSRFLDDWTIGDWVTVEYENVRSNLRIVKIQIAFEDGVETITPVLEDR